MTTGIGCQTTRDISGGRHHFVRYEIVGLRFERCDEPLSALFRLRVAANYVGNLVERPAFVFHREKEVVAEVLCRRVFETGSIVDTEGMYATNRQRITNITKWRFGTNVQGRRRSCSLSS
jgi:hypothetical protein